MIMSNTVLIIGESGSGKSSSIYTLNPKETFILNVLDKPLPFKGYKKNYVAATKENPDGNYYATDDYEKLNKILNCINTSKPHIKNVVIDDFQYLMANAFMRKALEKGYDKFTEIGQAAWQLIRDLTAMRADLTCFVISHSDTDATGKVKCKTIGKMLDDKITLEGMFTVILHALTNDGKYKFLTQHHGNYIAKSPKDMFQDKAIDNDLGYVLERMNEYYNEDINF